MIGIVRIYLDTCCIARPDDDQSQPRIRAETAAIERILSLCQERVHDWIASEAVYWEALRNPDARKRANTILRLHAAAEVLAHSQRIQT